ncbi:MAG: hypothetical protein ACRD0U_12305 [Acidimicrobiales bacterium]
MVVRTGVTGNWSLDVQELLTAKGGPWMHDSFRLLGSAYLDVPYDDPGPYQPDPPPAVDLGYVVDVPTILGGLGLGGPQSPPGCSMLGCP